MERLSDWRAGAWLALCLGAIAAAAALLIHARTAGRERSHVQPSVHATLVPRTHLFGQPVTATIDLPAGLRVRAAFAPYRLLSKTVTRRGTTTRYRFVLDCLTSACTGPPGRERQVQLPPVSIGYPHGKTLLGYWPPLRQASRLSPTDLQRPVLRGDLTAPEQARPPGSRLLLGTLLGVAAVLVVCAAALLGIAWLPWRPASFRPGVGRPRPSDLEYALIAAGLSAGGDAGERRAALESLAVSLQQRGLSDLARRARALAWSPRRPAGETLRRFTEHVQRAVRDQV